MNERDFVYWLRGFIEINKPESITDEQLQIIKDHLDKVIIEVKLRDGKPYVPSTLFPSTTLTC